MASPQNHNRNQSHKHDNDAAKDDLKSGSPRDEELKRRFVDQTGLEASDMPDKGRPTGYNDTVEDIGRRNLPHQHGGELLDSDANDQTGRSEGGLRGDRAISQASDSGHGGGRGKN